MLSLVIDTATCPRFNGNWRTWEASSFVDRTDRYAHTISYWCPIGSEPLSLTVFEIFASKYIWVTTLTFQGHVALSVTWPFWFPKVPFPIVALL